MPIQNTQDVVLTIKQAWPFIVLLATVVGGLVAFFVHIFTIRKSRLEIKKLQNDLSKAKLETEKLQYDITKAKLETEKLQHEVAKLNRENVARNNVIQVATFDQTLDYSGPVLRDLRASMPPPASKPSPSSVSGTKSRFFARLASWVAILAVVYFLVRLFDIWFR